MDQEELAKVDAPWTCNRLLFDPPEFEIRDANGHYIADNIHDEEKGQLMAAAPELKEALQCLADFSIDDPSHKIAKQAAEARNA